LKKRSLWLSAAAALIVAAALAGCGKTSYFAGRTLPPSGLLNRVLISIDNANALNKGALAFVDAFYDIRGSYNNKTASYPISGYSGAQPVSIQNMPEEQKGAVYSSTDGFLAVVNYATEAITGGNVRGLSGIYTSVFITRDQGYVFGTNPTGQIFTALDNGTGAGANFSLPGAYRVSVSPVGTSALVFAQNSNYAYYPRELTTAQGINYSGGPTTWPKAAIDCEPQTAPTWCLFQVQSPDHVDATGNAYGAPLAFDRPIKAVFSGDGSTAYVLNCGPECGGTTASIMQLPVAPMIFRAGQASGNLPTSTALASSTVAVSGGASNALVASSTIYIVGQQPQQVQGQTLFGGNLTIFNAQNNTVSKPISISDGQPGTNSRMILADDNTLWIGMIKCNNGVRAATGLPYGCLTMFNTATNSVTLVEPYQGDATGIASVTNLHKVYTAEGGQVYIHSTVDGSSIDNQYVTVTGTAYDVAYMDGISDYNNTVY